MSISSRKTGFSYHLTFLLFAGLLISFCILPTRPAASADYPVADSRIDYGETTGYGSSVTSADLTTNHSLVLTGLKPNTTYHYIVSSHTSGVSTTSTDNTFTTPDFIAATMADIGNSAVIEVSGNYDANNTDGSLNVVTRQKVAQEYFKTHGDTMDFLVMVSTFDYAIPDADSEGFYTPVKNDTLGINQNVFDNSAQYGSQNKLQGTIDIGNISELALNPYGELLNQTLTALGHEIMHRFGAYVRYKKTNNSLSMDLLGQDNAHWSYLFDSQGSLMYGNGWQDNGDGSFTSTEKQNSYCPLDLYLMGMIPKEQVPPMLLINNPAIDATQFPFLGATVNGTATTVTINDIIAAEGERVPSATTSPKQFNIGYILLVRHEDSIGQAAQALDIVRKGFAGRFTELTQGIGSIANVPASLEVVIDTPADNTLITGTSVQVAGTVINTTGVETGVIVNGVPAAVSGTHFMANAVDLQQGTNTITVTATDINGLTSTATRTVTAQSGNYIRLIPNIDSGTAPLNVTCTVNGSFSINNSQLFYTGPVDIYLTGTPTVTSYPLQFPQEGVYTLTVNVTGPDGLTYQDTVTVTVLPKLTMDRFFRKKWNILTSSLIRNDTVTALGTILTTARPNYQTMFSALSGQFPFVVSTQQAFNLVSVAGKRAKFELLTQESGSLYSYDVIFTKESNGLWAICEF